MNLRPITIELTIKLNRFEKFADKLRVEEQNIITPKQFSLIWRILYWSPVQNADKATMLAFRILKKSPNLTG